MSDQETYNAAMGGYRSALIQAQAEYQQAVVSGDTSAQATASMDIARLNRDMNDYHAFAVDHANSLQAAAPRNKYGLSPQEQEAARKSFSRGSLGRNDPGMTLDDMDRSYAENKARLRRLRQTGEYPNVSEQSG